MTEETTTWTGHTFTLFVFAGIVVLCSIFFILGMLVGRAEGQKVASAAGVPVKNDAKATQKEDKPDFTFYDSVKKNEDPEALQPPSAPKVGRDPEPGPLASPTPVAPVVSEPEKKAKAAPSREVAVEPPTPSSPRTPPNAINWQIGAMRKAADARKLLDEVKKKGFRAFILDPIKGDPTPVYRVQVGPFPDVVEAEEAKKKLEALKYQVYSKK